MTLTLTYLIHFFFFFKILFGDCATQLVLDTPNLKVEEIMRKQQRKLREASHEDIGKPWKFDGSETE